MTTVLWISAVGGALLFFALAGLVGLMYLLTAPWLFPIEGEGEPAMKRTKRRRFRKRVPELEPAAEGPLTAGPSEAEAHEAEQERRRRAAALAAAAACAEEGQAWAIPVESPGGWRQVHRARRLARTSVRQRARL